MADKKDFSKKAIELSKKYGGKITLKPTFHIKSLSDLSVVYTPGVASVSEAIYKNKDLSYDLTWRWNTIFIITNGTRVLGLGDVGPLASLPVMEGKSIIYKRFAGVNAIPIPINTKSIDEFVDIVEKISVTSGGIHLEDIESPFCFEALERLQKVLDVPVWHDDQQGTAAITLTGLINSFELVGKDLKRAKIVLVGAGAANLALFRLLKAYSIDPKHIILIDSKGVLSRSRGDLEQIKSSNPWKYNALIESNGENISNISDAFSNADVVVGFSSPGTITEDLIKRMASKPIVFANANPIPEIDPKRALDAGAYIVSTGRSDYPNQINNSLIFPGLFRGILDSRSKVIDDGTAISAALELVSFTKRKGISRNYIVPRMDEFDIYPRVASAVAEYSSNKGYSLIKGDKKFFYNLARKRIKKFSS